VIRELHAGEKIDAMTKPASPALAAALICFAIYFGNVMLGASDIGVILGDVAEMLMLVAAVVLFVIGVLKREALEKSASGKD
jgi:hypothetical protein